MYGGWTHPVELDSFDRVLLSCQIFYFVSPFSPLFSTFFTLFAGIPQLLLGPGQLIFDMTRHSLVKLAAAVALFLCQTQAAPQAKPKPNALPIVDLGYELYQASSFNVSLKAMLSIS